MENFPLQKKLFLLRRLFETTFDIVVSVGIDKIKCIRYDLVFDKYSLFSFHN